VEGQANNGVRSKFSSNRSKPWLLLFTLFLLNGPSLVFIAMTAFKVGNIFLIIIVPVFFNPLDLHAYSYKFSSSVSLPQRPWDTSKVQGLSSFHPGPQSYSPEASVIRSDTEVRNHLVSRLGHNREWRDRIVDAAILPSLSFIQVINGEFK